MRYYVLDTLGEGGEEWAVIDTPPQAFGISYFRAARGKRITDRVPELEDVRIVMSKDYPGLRLGSLLGNTLGYLMADSGMRELIQARCADIEVEYIPFTLYDRKNRVRSSDYQIVNPIGTVDCLNVSASGVSYLDEPDDPYHGEVVDVERIVLDPKKLDGVPALFRVKERAATYIVSEALADDFHDAPLSNVILTEAEQRASDSSSLD